MKKWNWSGFWFVIIMASLGITSNENVTTFTDGLIFVLLFGLPTGLLVAWISKD